MLRRLGARFETFFRAVTPDPFVVAVLLTAAVLLAALLRGHGPAELLHAWRADEGLFGLLAFSMQMVLILVTGHALAAAAPIRALLERLARLPRTGGAAAAMVAAVAIGAGLLNWGLGLVIGALVAREVGRSCARRGVVHHYPLIAAAGYAGMMTWHAGLSGTAPLMMTTEPDVRRFLGESLASEIGTVAFSRTVLSPANLLVTGALLVGVPFLFRALAPRPGDAMEGIETFAPAEDPAPESTPERLLWPERLERSRIVMMLLAIPATGAVALFFIEIGVDRLDPNAIILIFLTAGLWLHLSLRAYARAVSEAIGGASGIVLQFPLYAGIMGVMRVSGMGDDLARWMSEAAPAALAPALTFVSAGLLNLLIPSGGGQWALQGPIVMDVAQRTGLDPAIMILAVAYGDQWTNMLQPFWALPLLAITGARARDIVGYTALVMLFGGAFMALSLTLM